MSDITTVRNALGNKLDSLGIIVYDRWEGDVVPPAALIVPPRGTVISYVTSEGGPSSTHDLNLSIQLLVSKSVDKYAQETLDEYVSPTGTKSIYQNVSGDLSNSHWCEVMEARNYGTVQIGMGENARQYLGVEFIVSIGLYE